MDAGDRSLKPKDYTIHMIGNAHIDPVWLWRMGEGRSEVRATCRAALERMRETPVFTFSRGSAATYRWLEEDDPEAFEEIRRRVAEGRWHLVGGWWEQPDCNIPCGESFVRQALYGKRYFQDRFGVDVRVGYNVDSFGHHGMLPQILRKCGLTHYVFFRPGAHEKALPHLFWWESADGSRVLACRPGASYTTHGEELRDRIEAALKQIPEHLRDGVCFYGVGNHGGGPTKENIRTILECAADPACPDTQFSSLDRFFEAVMEGGKDLPVVRDDLQHHAVGCYSAVSRVKRENRKAECLLMTAERFAAVATAVANRPYPQAELEEAWKRVLFNQFHDVLAGTSIPEAYEDADELYARTFSAAQTVLEGALGAIAAKVETEGEGHALLVFNPLPWERHDVVEGGIALPSIPEGLLLRDEQGEPVPVQQTGLVDASRRGTVVGMAFEARVPGLGYRVYRLEPQKGAGRPESELQTAPESLENRWWRVTFDPSVGCMSSLYDKEHDVEVLSGRGGLPLVLEDNSDTWSHGVSAFRDELGCFVANGRVTVVERGPVRAAIRVESTFGDSRIVQDVRLYAGMRRIECRTTVDWHERHRMLKLSIPVHVREAKATYEIPYGSMGREADGREEPAQRWVDVSGYAENGKGERLAYGVSLLNDGKYGFDVKGSELRMTVLRSPIYAFHDPRQRIAGVTYRYTDQGEQTFLYALLPHAGPDWMAETVREGHSLNNPLIQTVEGPHDGALGGAQSFLEVGPENVVATVLKRAEDSGDLVLRMYETAGKDGVARISCRYLEASASVPIGHHEVKTVKITSWAGGKLQVRDTDMLERENP